MRRQFRAGPDERERIRRTLVAVLESEPGLEFAWLHGSFLAADAFRDIDIGVHLNAAAEVRIQRGGGNWQCDWIRKSDSRLTYVCSTTLP